MIPTEPKVEEILFFRIFDSGVFLSHHTRDSRLPISTCIHQLNRFPRATINGNTIEG